MPKIRPPKKVKDMTSKERREWKMERVRSQNRAMFDAMHEAAERAERAERDDE